MGMRFLQKPTIYNGYGAAITTAEYGSAKECNQAGEVWKTTIHNVYKDKYYYRPSFVCTNSTASDSYR